MLFNTVTRNKNKRRRPKKIPFNTTKVINKQITRIAGRMTSNTVRIPLVLPNTDGVMLEAAMLLSVGVPFSVDLGK